MSIESLEDHFGPDLGLVDIVAPVGYGIPANSHTTSCDNPPCDLEENIFAYFGGTSAAAPQAAGVVALLRSRFPGFTQDQVRIRVRGAAEWYWTVPPTDDELKRYGGGKLNAYRALTEWGSLTGAVTWTTNTLLPYLQGGEWVNRPGSRDGKYYVSGDLTIEPGATLTIDAGTIVNVAPDHEQAGTDPNRVQIVVKGTLNINGTAESPVTFQSFNDQASPSNGDWIGIKFEAGSSGTISHAVIKNAAVAIENHAAVTLTDCTIRDCGVVIDGYADVTLTNCVVTNNAGLLTAVDLHDGDGTVIKCTLASNIGSAVAVRAGSTVSIDSSVVAFNGGPAVRELSGWTGTAFVGRSVLYGNATASGSPTDADWQLTGADVLNQNPAFCNAASRNYRLYAFSPAAAGPHYTWRVGALDVGCVPEATITAGPEAFSFVSGDTNVVFACPAGPAGYATRLKVSVNLVDSVITRDIGATELTLDPTSFTAKLFDSDGLGANGSASSTNGYTTTLLHDQFSFHDFGAIRVLLNGTPLANTAPVDIRTPDLKIYNGAYGSVDVLDFQEFGQHYQSPPKVYARECDFNGDSTITLPDFIAFSEHYQDVTTNPQVNSVVTSATSSAQVVLGFVEEFVTATDHRLYVDVGVDNFAGVTTSVLSLRAGNPELSLVEWEPSASRPGEILFTPVVRDGTDELFFGLLVSPEFEGAAAPLGRLVFHVETNDPVQIAEDDFVLSVGDVLVQSRGGPAIPATMSGAMTRALGPAVARVYHNRLEQNFPNPFNPTTTIAFSLKDPSDVRLTIYDVAGRRVREVLNAHRERGAYRVVWDGRDDRGSGVASGVYFYKLVAGSFTDTKKMTVLK